MILYTVRERGVDIKYISVDESQISVFFLDCFRVCVNDTEYNVVLNKPDVDTYEYEIWKRVNREMSLIKIVTLSLDEFKDYYYADERSTNFRIIDSVIVPLIEKMR